MKFNKLINNTFLNNYKQITFHSDTYKNYLKNCYEANNDEGRTFLKEKFTPVQLK